MAWDMKGDISRIQGDRKEDCSDITIDVFLIHSQTPTIQLINLEENLEYSTSSVPTIITEFFILYKNKTAPANTGS